MNRTSWKTITTLLLLKPVFLSDFLSKQRIKHIFLNKKMPFFMHKTWTAPELNVVRSVIYLNVTKKNKTAKNKSSKSYSKAVK